MKRRSAFFYIFVYSVLQNRRLQEGNKKLQMLVQVVQVLMQMRVMRAGLDTCVCSKQTRVSALLPCRSVLTVACEQTEVLLFDPISSKHIKTLSEAHEDCVNNIR